MNRYNPIETGATSTKSKYDPIPTTFKSSGPISLAGLPYVEGPGANTPAGIAYNTVAGLPKAAVDLAKWAGQGIARTVGSVGITAGNLPTQIVNRTLATPITLDKSGFIPSLKGKQIKPLLQKQPLPFGTEVDTSVHPVSKALFGGEPINTIPTQIAKTKKALEPYIGETAAGRISAPLIAGSTFLDLSGFGGGKAVKKFAEIPEAFYKAMAKEENPSVIKAILKMIGVAEDDAAVLAPTFAKTKTKQEVKQAMMDYRPAGKGVTVPGATAGTTPVPTPPAGVAPMLTAGAKSAEASRFATGQDLVNYVSQKGTGVGASLNVPEMKQLVQHLTETDPTGVVRQWGKDIQRGTIYKPYGYNTDKKLDIVLGTDGKNGLIVAQLNPNGTLDGRFRTHGTVIEDKDIVQVLGKDELTQLSSGQPVPTPPAGTGYKKFVSSLEKMVKNKTLLPEDVTILKTIFEGTDDAFLGSLNVADNARFKSLGRFQVSQNRFTGAVRPETNKLELKKGLAGMGLQNADQMASKVFTHEFGHAGYYLVLNAEERRIVDNIYRSMTPAARRSVFEGGLSHPSEGRQAPYYAKNPQEFFAESFAGYVMENKVPAEAMRPLLQRLLTKFYEGLKRLVNRGQVAAVNRLRPLYEKILAGDKSTPLSVFADAEPASFKQELQTMLAEMPKPGAVTKEVPVSTLMPTVSPAMTPETAQTSIPSTVSPTLSPSQAGTSLPSQAAIQAPTTEVSIPKSITGDLQKESSYVDSIQQKILDARKAQGYFDDYIEVAPDPIEFPQQVADIRNMATAMNLPEKVGGYKDIGTIKSQFRDVQRNSEQVFGKDFPIVDANIFEPFDNSKKVYINTLEKELADFESNIWNKFKQGSKEDRAIQRYGEGFVKYDGLVNDFGKAKADEIVKAEDWFRQKYDQYITRLNQTEMQIYPNSPHKWTPKRADYFRHYHELSSDFSRLQNILENPTRIDPMLVGISQATKPKSRWASFKQMRTGGKTEESAIGGFLNYLPSYSYAVNIDPNIGKFRELADALARATNKTKNLNNYIYNLRMFANELSGKTSEPDRIVSDIFGRNTLQAVDWVNKRVKSNTILFSLSASLSQIFNIPQGIASAGIIDSTKGLSKTLGQIFVHNKAMEKSTFIKERFFSGFSKFDKGMLNNAKKFGAWMVTVGDELGTKFIWNGQYEKALREGVANPIRYADVNTRKLVAGRGIGEKPLIQNSKVFQVLAPFQYEVTNLWWAMEDMAKSDKSVAKKMSQFITLFVALYLLNNTTEKATGNRVALDPIQMTLDGIDSLSKGEYLKAGGRVFGEVLSNIPGGQTVAGMYPEYGTTISGVKIPTRKELFGRTDPTRFGGGLLVSKGIMDPFYKLLPPFGGGQLKKSLQGLEAVSAGKSTTAADKFQYSIPQTPENYLKGALFGKAATTGGQSYYKKETKAPTTTTKKNRYNPI